VIQELAVSILYPARRTVSAVEILMILASFIFIQRGWHQMNRAKPLRND
jgi:hypothetical protein